jgi:hypothetical protein
MTKTCTLVLLLTFLLVGGCAERKSPDRILLEGYVLSSYGNGGHYAHYIVGLGNQVVVPSAVETVGIAGNSIIGSVRDIKVPEMPRVSDGYFILDAPSGRVQSGLTIEQLRQILGISDIRLQPSNRWSGPPLRK